MARATPLLLLALALSAPVHAADKVEPIPADAPLAPVAPEAGRALGASTPDLALPQSSLSVSPAAAAGPARASAAAALPARAAQAASAAGLQAQAERSAVVPDAPGRMVAAGERPADPAPAAETPERRIGFQQAVARLRAGMNGPGYALIDGKLLLDPAIEAGLLEQARRHLDPRTPLRAFNTWELFERPPEVLRKRNPALDGWKMNPAGVRGFVDAITAALRQALPDERLVAQDAQLRLRLDQAEEMEAHVDGQYITVTYALEGPGTWLYDDSGPQVQLIKAPAGQLAVITNRDRAWLTQAPGTVHAPPAGVVRGRRALLIIRYQREGFNESDPAVRDALNRRAETRAALVERRWERERAARAQPRAPPSGGLLGSIKRLFE